MSDEPVNNLQDVLRLSITATAASTAEAPSSSQATSMMDPDRRQFLEKILSQMSVDPIDQLRRGIQTINNLLNDLDKGVENPDDIIGDIDSVVDGVIIELIGSIDFARDFYKLDGLPLIKRLIATQNPQLIIKACDILAETTQNNLNVQTVLLESGTLKMLVNLLQGSNDEVVKVKALYAISCLIRENPKAIHAFDKQCDGLSALLQAIQYSSATNKLRIKASFLISSLACFSSTLRDTMIEMGFIDEIAALLHSEHDASHEHLASTLSSLVTSSGKAKQECQREELGLEKVARDRIKELKDDPQHLDEVRIYQDILDECFPSS